METIYLPVQLSERAAIIRIPSPRDKEGRNFHKIILELIKCAKAMMMAQQANEVLQVIFNYVPLSEDVYAKKLLDNRPE